MAVLIWATIERSHFRGLRLFYAFSAFSSLVSLIAPRKRLPVGVVPAVASVHLAPPEGNGEIYQLSSTQ